MKDSPDVISPDRSSARQSPFPLGLGVYSTAQDGGMPSPLPLFYVSPLVAAVRAPGYHEQNAPGVHPGWYAMAKPDEIFDVRISIVNKTRAEIRNEDCMEATLHVDGMSTHSGNVFYKWCVFEEVVERGFVQRSVMDGPSKCRRTIRPFVFRSTISKDPDVKDSTGRDVGTIRLSVYRAKRVYEDPSDFVDSAEFNYPSRTDVTEKAAMKEGRSLRAGTQDDVISEACDVGGWTTRSRRRVKGAGVEVYIRERTWMRSRRLIDDEGRPCTAAKLRVLLQQDRPRPRAETGSRRSKKAKIQPMLLEKESKPGDGESADQQDVKAIDVVDLT